MLSVSIATSTPQERRRADDGDAEDRTSSKGRRLAAWRSRFRIHRTALLHENACDVSATYSMIHHNCSNATKCIQISRSDLFWSQLIKIF